MRQCLTKAQWSLSNGNEKTQHRAELFEFQQRAELSTELLWVKMRHFARMGARCKRTRIVCSSVDCYRQWEVGDRAACHALRLVFALLTGQLHCGSTFLQFSSEGTRQRTLARWIEVVEDGGHDGVVGADLLPTGLLVHHLQGHVPAAQGHLPVTHHHQVHCAHCSVCCSVV